MDERLPTLPIGKSGFKEIRNVGDVYVDKTMFLPSLSLFGKVIFCARPRRFGKSLAISTLDSFFSGDKELFKGLAAWELMNSPDFVPRPVIRLLMSRPSGAESKDILKQGIVSVLEKNAERHGVSLRGADAADMFSRLVEDVSKAYSKKVVLLVDEYDAPVIKVVQTPGLSKIEDLLEDTRTVMSNFYSKIKDLDEELHFVFITGVTKFSRMGVFSTLNSIKDISLFPEFASFLGFTHEELSNNFQPFIKKTADHLRLSEPETLKKIQEYYDGFSFDGESRVYNPFSTLNFFQDMEFSNFWMESGSNTLIREMIKGKSLTVAQFSRLKVSKDFAKFPGEIEKTPPEGFLYQAGYLTLRRDSEPESSDAVSSEAVLANAASSFILDYPNFEVRSAISRLFIENIFQSDHNTTEAINEFKNNLKSCDIVEIISNFRDLLTTIVYDDHLAGMRLNVFQAVISDKRFGVRRLLENAVGSKKLMELIKNINKAIEGNKYTEITNIENDIITSSGSPEQLRLKIGENLYRPILQSYILASGFNVASELHTNLGRSDLTFEAYGRRYVIEVKVVAKTDQAEEMAREALKQIIEKNYAAPSHSKPVLLGLAISEEKRNIAACLFVKDGKMGKLKIRTRYDKVLEDLEKGKRQLKSENQPQPRGPRP